MDFLHGPPVCVCVCANCVSAVFHYWPAWTCIWTICITFCLCQTCEMFLQSHHVDLKKNKKTGYSSRRTYSLCKGRILVSWCRGTQWGQSWLLEEVQTRRRPCNRRQAQSESWTDHTLSLKTWYSEASSVCPHQPCNSLMTGRVFITHRHDWWMHSTQKMSTDKKMNYRKKWCNC